MLKSKLYPILFYKNKENFNFINNIYKIKYIKKILNKYFFLKKFYYILYYADLMLLDKQLLFDLKKNKKKIFKYLELTKKDFLFFYYNKKIYNYTKLLKLITFDIFNFNFYFYFLNFKNKNKKILNVIFYLKKKKCLL